MSNTLIILLVLALSILISGLSRPQSSNNPSPEASSPPVSNGSCCDNNQCDPTKTSKSFSFTRPDGQTHKYGLLRSSVTLREYNAHMKDTGEKFEGDPIVISTAEEFGARYNECGQGKDDQVWGTDEANTACVAIPNDSLIYVCRDKCYPEDRSYRVCALDFNVPCFGQLDAVYDVYYSIPQYLADGSVPDVIKQCTSSSSSRITKQIVEGPSPLPGEPNLQLKNLVIKNVDLQSASAGWISPFCKPAIYLYPEKTTDVNVQVSAEGGLLNTLPNYPSAGWTVKAYPGGTLSYQGLDMDYLYYESRIADNQLERPKEGYVVSDVAKLLDELLPKLGLNERESKQFKEYWINVLPKSNYNSSGARISSSAYYFIGVMPSSEVEKFSNLEISPKPDSVLRVTLYFEALDGPISVATPSLEPIKRDGFTVVEWGGIFKKDPKHPFSCLM